MEPPVYRIESDRIWMKFEIDPPQNCSPACVELVPTEVSWTSCNWAPAEERTKQIGHLQFKQARIEMVQSCKTWPNDTYITNNVWLCTGLTTSLDPASFPMSMISSRAKLNRSPCNCRVVQGQNVREPQYTLQSNEQLGLLSTLI